MQRNGSAEAWSLERSWNGARVRTGRSDALLPEGTHVYEIHYRTALQIGYFADHDELYWNVNGNGWPFALDHVSAEVRLPKAVPEGELRADAYTGAKGARGSDYRYLVRDGGVGFTSTAPLRPAEAMMIVVGFPKGIVAEPGAARRLGWVLSQDLVAVVALGAGALLLLLLYRRWSRVTRDSPAGPK